MANSTKASLGYEVERVSPSACFGARVEADAAVRESLARHEPVLREMGTDEYNLRRFRSAAFHFIPLLMEAGVELKRATMVEVGCGRGLKGLAWGELVGRYVGIDIAESEIELGRELRRRAGRTGDELICGDAAALLRGGGRLAPGAIDILVLYAVLEHLTARERVEILGFARACYEAGGLVVIAETPNRLIPFDHHSSQKHFLQMLPDDLALRHLRRFQDHPLKNLLAASDEYAPVALYRSGRGMSYHDFELDFCDGPVDLQLTADGWHPALLDLQPVTRAELGLQGYFEDNGVAVPRAFSRAWLDLFLRQSGAEAPRRVRLVRPRGGAARQEDRRFWAMDTYVPTGAGPVKIEATEGEGGLGCLLMHAEDAESGCEVRVNGEVVRAVTGAELQALRPPTWHQRFSVVLELPREGWEVTVGQLGRRTVMPTSGVVVAG